MAMNQPNDDGQQHSARRPRSDKGQRQLTQRDLDTLLLIGQQYTYCFDQLQGVLARHPDTQSAEKEFLSETRTRAAIEKWKQLQLADSRKILHSAPQWVWLTRRGLYHVRLTVAYWEPEHSDLEHYFWINETRAYLENVYLNDPKYEDVEWESERLWRAKRDRLLKEKKHDNALWIPEEYQSKHRPDAVFRYREGRHSYIAAVEIELTQKSYPTWKAIWNELLRHYGSVWYYVDKDIKGAFSAALKRYQNEKPAYGEPGEAARQRIYVNDLEQTL
jgi:hypothetical protein